LHATDYSLSSNLKE